MHKGCLNTLSSRNLTFYPSTTPKYEHRSLTFMEFDQKSIAFGRTKQQDKRCSKRFPRDISTHCQLAAALNRIERECKKVRVRHTGQTIWCQCHDASGTPSKHQKRSYTLHPSSIILDITSLTHYDSKSWKKCSFAYTLSVITNKFSRDWSASRTLRKAWKESWSMPTQVPP